MTPRGTKNTPPPVAGDHVTLYTLPEAAPHFRISVETLRLLEKTGTWPRELFTWLGGKVFMTGDQMVRAIALGANAAVDRPVRTRRGRPARVPRRPAPKAA